MKDSKQSERPCWIDTVEPEDASTELAEAYRQVGATHNRIHNLYRAFSLQPKPMISADRHYRDVLHNERNHSEPWILELLATQVAFIADCEYAMTNHGANFEALLDDAQQGKRMLNAMRRDDFSNRELFSEKHAALLEYGAKISRAPETLCKNDLQKLRSAGIPDTEILEAVQASACFAYWVRFINALGVQLGNESIGRYADPGNSDD